ncbi:MAG: hypothetical protein K6A23_15345 [Butyrivibrio sp.]|nr:hypothetical protein [Butyrivibrio sp.]
MANYTKEDFEALAFYTYQKANDPSESANHRFSRRISLFSYTADSSNPDEKQVFENMFKKDAFAIGPDGTVNYDKAKNFFVTLGKFTASKDVHYAKKVANNKDSLSDENYFKNLDMHKYYEKLLDYAETDNNILKFNENAAEDRKITKDTLKKWFEEGYKSQLSENKDNSDALESLKKLEITDNIINNRKAAEINYYQTVAKEKDKYFNVRLSEAKNMYSAYNKKLNEEKIIRDNATIFYRDFKKAQDSIKNANLEADNIKKCYEKHHSDFTTLSLPMTSLKNSSGEDFKALAESISAFVTSTEKDSAFIDNKLDYKDNLNVYNAIEQKADSYIKKHNWGPWGMFNFLKTGQTKEKFNLAKKTLEQVKKAKIEFSHAFMTDKICNSVNTLASKDIDKMSPNEIITSLSDTIKVSNTLLTDLGIEVKNGEIPAQTAIGPTNPKLIAGVRNLSILNTSSNNFVHSCTDTGIAEYDNKGKLSIDKEAFNSGIMVQQFDTIVQKPSVNKTDDKNLANDLNMVKNNTVISRTSSKDNVIEKGKNLAIS